MGQSTNVPLHGRIFGLRHIHPILLILPISSTLQKLNMLKMRQIQQSVSRLGCCQKEYLEYLPNGIFVEDWSPRKQNMLKICHLGCCQKELQGKICRGCQPEPATFKLNTVNCKIENLQLKTGDL